MGERIAHLLQMLSFHTEQEPVGKAILAVVRAHSGSELTQEGCRNMAVLVVAQYVLQFLSSVDDLVCLAAPDRLRDLGDIPVPLPGFTGSVQQIVGLLLPGSARLRRCLEPLVKLLARPLDVPCHLSSFDLRSLGERSRVLPTVQLDDQGPIAR